MNNKQLADKLTTELTGILNYVVSDDVQLFSKDTKIGGEEFVPAVISTISSFENDNRFVRTFVYQLTFKVRSTLVDSFYSDMADYKASQTTEVIGSYTVTKITESPIFQEKHTTQGVVYHEFTMELRWVYALSKVGTSVIIKIDDVQVPFQSCDVIHDKSYVSNQAQGSNYRMTNDLVTLQVPLIVANTKILEFYNDVNSNTYNKTYVLDIDGVEKTLVLKKGQYTFTNSSSLTGLILTLETHYPRLEILIDGVSLPITAYQYQGKKIIETSSRSGGGTKGYGSSKVRTWSITIVKDGSATWTKLYNDAYDDTLDITYTLEGFTVELADAVVRFTETGDMTLECQFTEYGS